MYQEAIYSSADRAAMWKGKFAGVAIARLETPIDSLIVFNTVGSSQWCDEFQKACDESSVVSPKFYTISSGIKNTEQWDIVDAVISSVLSICTSSEPTEIVLDITHGYRSLPLLYFTAISFLTTFYEISLAKVVYALVNRKTSQAKIIDMTSAFSVIEWYHAANIFVQSEEVDALLKLVNHKRDSLRTNKQDFSRIEIIRKRLQGITAYIGAALPLEIGMKLHGLHEDIRSSSDGVRSLPLFAHFIEKLEDMTKAIALPNKKKKNDILLVANELNRQYRVIERSLEYDQLSNALIMLREYIVNKVAFHVSAENWLSHTQRLLISNKLSALSKHVADDLLSTQLSDEQRMIGKLWDGVTQLRNQIAHCGYSQNEVEVHKVLLKTREYLQEVDQLDYSTVFDRSLAQTRLLVCPLGKSKGTIYSAISHTNPDRILAICSRDTCNNLDEVIRFFRNDVFTIAKVIVDDPYRTFDAIPSIVEENRHDIASSSEVMVHVVVGTTMMGELARGFGREARRLGIPHVVFATVDTRDYETQQKDPYVVGEYIELEKHFMDYGGM